MISARDCTHRRGSIDLHVSMLESVSQARVSMFRLVLTSHVDEDLPCSTRSSALCSVITLWEKNLENRECLYMHN